MARRDYSGNAVPTTLTAELQANGLVASIQAADGWPSGGGSGKFFVIINHGQSNEEHALVASRTGTTLTFADVSDRGADNTTPAIHAAGSTIHHGIAAVDADEANDHINTTARDDHSQYLNNARHDVEARHTFGGALGVPGTPAKIGTVEASGTGDDPAREDHVHELGDGAIDSPAQFAAGVVETAALDDDAVTAPKLATDSVTADAILAGAVGNAELGANAVTTAKIQDLAVTAGKIADGAIDTPGKFGGSVIPLTAIGDGLLTLIKFASEAFTAYDPALTNVVLGAGGTKSGRYIKLGRMVAGQAQFELGAGGDVTGNPAVGVPFAAASTGADWFMGARAIDTASGARAAGVGLVVSGANTGGGFCTAGLALWDATVPWNWQNGSSMWVFFFYEAAA